MFTSLQKTLSTSLSPKNYWCFLTMFFLGLINTTNIQAQLVTSYKFSETNVSQTYTPITGGTVFASGAFTDVTPASVAMGFSFNFNGTVYTNCTVTDNGFVTFGATAPVATTYQPINGALLYAGAVAGFTAARGLQGSEIQPLNYPALTYPSSVSYVTEGVSPNRIFVIQYRNVVRRIGATPAIGVPGILNFQIRLYETSNKIETVYNTFNPNENGVAATGVITNQQVGLRGAANTDFNNRKTGWSPSTTGTANADSMNLNSTAGNFPAAVTKFTWEPCYQPLALSATAIPNSVVTWTAPYVPSGNYNWEIRTSGAFGSGASGLVTSGTTGLTTFTASGLIVGTTYTIYVQSSCGGAPVSTTIVPACGIATIPYTQNFESSVVPALPLCNSNVLVTGQPFVTKFNATVVLPAKTFTTKYITCAAGTNSWYFTEQINFPAAGTYKLSYDYGCTREFAFNEQKMRVAYGPNNSLTAGAMTGGTIIEDHTSIKDSPLSNIINFVVTTPGNYYIGFQCYGPNSSNNTLQLDNIVLDVSTCLGPTAITAQNVTITSSTALITWNNPASIPDEYIYFWNTTGTPPANSDIIGKGTTSGTSILLSGLAGSTNYFVWVRSVCDGGLEFGSWIPLSVPGAFFTTLAPPPSYCVSNGGVASLNYFTNVTTNNGNNNINNTSTYSVNGYGDFTSQVVSQGQGQSVDIVTSYNLINASNDLGVAVYVDWNQDGDFLDVGERVYNSGAFLTAPPTITFTVPATATLGATRMRLVVDYFATSPTSCGTKTRGETEDYTFLVVSAPPALTLNIYTSTQCAGTNSPTVTITNPNYCSTCYVWSGTPAPTGTYPNYIFNSTVNTTYTLTATQNVTPFGTNTVKFNYVASPLPSQITITPINPTACQGTAVKLTSAGGIVDGIPIFQESFEDLDNEFTYTTGAAPITTSPINNSTGGNPAGPKWSLEQSPFTTTGPSTPEVISSNDNSQFYISDSDAGLGTGTTDTQLISNPINLATIGINPITDANLTFWHYYKNLGTAKVEISLDGGGSWVPTPLVNYTSTQGKRNQFVKAEINLLPYVGNNNVRIRFKYNATFGWYWAIDNVEITVSSNSNVLWNSQIAPVANGAIVQGLFTAASAAPGTEYLAGSAAASVWALPTATTTYTASAKTASPNNCPRTSNVTVNYQPIVAGTVSSAQTVCSGIANDLTLSGQVGTIQWEVANVLAFTSPTNIGTNSTTLTSAEIGAVVADKYYRAKITNGVCTVYTNIVKIGTNAVTWNFPGIWSNGTGPTINDAAIFSFNYNSTGNLSACSIAINSGAVVTIGTTSTPHVLTVQNAITTTGGTLIFNNGSSLIQNNNNANTTPITYRRNSTLMNPFDYTYWSSPVAGQTLLGFSPSTLQDKFYYWNTNTAVYDWTIVPTVSTTTMQTGQGYLIRSPLAPASAPAIFNGEFVGNPNNGNLTRAIEVSGPLNAKNLNLIGNPYPSGLSASLFLTANSSVIDGTIFFWSHNTPISGFSYTTNDYASYNLTGGAGTKAANNLGAGGVGNNSIPDGNIASGQGFFAIGKIAGTNNVNFTNAMRVTGNSNFYRNNNSGNDYEKNRIWLEMSNNQGAFSQMLYGNIEGATNAKDQLYDGVLFEESPTASLYSVLDNYKLTIKGNGLPFAETDTNQIGFISKIAGNYQIKLAMFDGLFESQNIYLEDKFVNTIHDLKLSDYNFSTNIGTFDDRFVLRFTNTVLSNNNIELNTNSIVVYKDASGIHIKSAKDEIKNVIIFDATGRNVVDKTNVNGTELNINGLQIAQQVLLVQVTTVDGKTTTRKIIF